MNLQATTTQISSAWSATATARCIGSHRTSMYLHEGATAHFSCLVRDVINIISHYPLHGLQPIFTYDETLNPLWTQLLPTREMHFTITLRMSVRLFTTSPESLNGCSRAWWDISRRALNLVEDITAVIYIYSFS